jgi:hypothetical protein
MKLWQRAYVVKDIEMLGKNFTISQKLAKKRAADIEAKGRAFETSHVELIIQINPFTRQPTFNLDFKLSPVPLLDNVAILDVREGIKNPIKLVWTSSTTLSFMSMGRTLRPSPKRRRRRKSSPQSACPVSMRRVKSCLGRNDSRFRHIRRRGESR